MARLYLGHFLACFTMFHGLAPISTTLAVGGCPGTTQRSNRRHVGCATPLHLAPSFTQTSSQPRFTLDSRRSKRSKWSSVLGIFQCPARRLTDVRDSQVVLWYIPILSACQGYPTLEFPRKFGQALPAFGACTGLARIRDGQWLVCQIFSPVGLQYEIVGVDVSEVFSQVTASTCFRA